MTDILDGMPQRQDGAAALYRGEYDSSKLQRRR